VGNDNKTKNSLVSDLLGGVGKSLRSLSNFSQATGLLLIFIFAMLLSPRQHGTGMNIFLSAANLSDVLRQVSENGIIALGMTYVILTAGIDLSVGSLLALSATFVAKMLTEWHPGLSWNVQVTVIILMALGLTTLCGTTMGLLISKLKVQPFIITLAGIPGATGVGVCVGTGVSVGTRVAVTRGPGVHVSATVGDATGVARTLSPPSARATGRGRARPLPAWSM